MPEKTKALSDRLAVPVLVMTALRVVGDKTTALKLRLLLELLNTGAGNSAVPLMAVLKVTGLGSVPKPMKLTNRLAERVPAAPLAGVKRMATVQEPPPGMTRVAQDSLPIWKSAALVPPNAVP